MKSRTGKWLAAPIATCLGLGYSPFAPGTAGSLGALAAAMVLREYHGWGQAEFALLAAAWLIPGIWAAHVFAAESGQKDPSRVVVDEAIGQWVTLAGAARYNWKSWLAAFVLFRLFDIWKPPPIRQAERLPGGIGIVADDVVAGLAGALVLYAAGWFNLY
jgi:phosphatidylglycerophosphatase A